MYLLIVFLLGFALQAGISREISGEKAFAVQVKSHSNVKVIESAKKTLMAKYPDKTYLTQFRSPNYILSVGYFATEGEAQEFKKEIEKDFPGCSVVSVEKKN